MDPHEITEPVKCSNKDKCGGKSNNSCKLTPRLECENVRDNNKQDVLASTSAQPDAGNGPLDRYINTFPNTDSSHQSRMSSDSYSESLKNHSAQAQTSNFNSSYNHQVASNSKHSDVNPYNGNASSELQICQRHQVCLDKAAAPHNGPTFSASKTCEKSVEDKAYKQNRKRPSNLRLKKPNFLEDDSSSDTGNDDFSLGSEDGCIYTYRGGEHLADLPSSFFSLDMGLPLDRHLPAPPNYVVRADGAPNEREPRSRPSSPEMDFLEMDFDPGPSCEADTGDELSPDADIEEVLSIPEEAVTEEDRVSSPKLEAAEPTSVAEIERAGSVPAGAIKAEASTSSHYDGPSTSSGITHSSGHCVNQPEAITADGPTTYGPYITHVNSRGERLLVRRTRTTSTKYSSNNSINMHASCGNLVSPREKLNHDEELKAMKLFHQINQGERPMDSLSLASTLYHIKVANNFLAITTKSDDDNSTHCNMPSETQGVSLETSGAVEVPRCMIWSEREACERQVTQIGNSACGATAIVNVFVALGVPVNIDRISSAVGTRQRANNAPIPRYLLSRSVAGCTAADLVQGAQRASDGLITARFFPTHPERIMSLSHWLADWISLGAVPILTLNLQAGITDNIPDAWHHQMVFGVSSEGVYLSNPMQCVQESTLWPQLTSPSVLMVRARDVWSRYTNTTDLTPLLAVPDRRFRTFNVLGQVAHVIREWVASLKGQNEVRTRHIYIPASYQAGITIAALTGSEAHKRLMHASQLAQLYDDRKHDPHKSQ